VAKTNTRVPTCTFVRSIPHRVSQKHSLGGVRALVHTNPGYKHTLTHTHTHDKKTMLDRQFIMRAGRDRERLETIPVFTAFTGT